MITFTEQLRGQFRHSWRTGSNYTVDPPVTDTDVDTLILVKNLSDALTILTDDWDEAGWELLHCCTPEGKKNYESDTGYADWWYSLRRGNENLIVTDNQAWYFRAIAATELCRAFNLKNKEDRINVFRYIRDSRDEYDINGLLDEVLV